MKFLFTAGALHGHVNPMLPLALAAQRAGHEVAFATGPDMAPQVQRAGVECWPVGMTHAQAGGNDQASWLDYFARTARARAAQLVPRALRWRPDVVVHEDTELAGAVAAATCRVRHHWVHGLGLMPPARLGQALAPALASLAAPWQVADAWQRLLDATYLDVCPPALRAPDERVWRKTQALRPSAAAPWPGDCLPAAFDALPFERTVALSLGTVFNGAHAVFDAALAGLRTLRVNVVVVTGPGSDPARLGPQPPRVLVESFVPYALLLPRVDALVSHGGAGGVFAALGHGLPQLLMPQGADQHANTQACARAGAALAIESAPVHARDVAALTARLLDEPQYARAAEAVRRQIVEMPDAADVIEALLARDPTATPLH